MQNKELIQQAKTILNHYKKNDRYRYECICTICFKYGYDELKEIVQDTVNIYAKLTKQRNSKHYSLRHDAFMPWDYIDTPEFRQHRIILLETIIDELKRY